MAKTNLYLFANWKMYLDLAGSEKLAKDLVKLSKKLPKKIKMTVFPSALSFVSVTKNLKNSIVGVGPQNFYFEDKGGFTGEISADMYKKSGAKYALIGHSERRHLFHETNHEIRMKMEAALNVGLIPVLCVGETSHEREAGKTKETIEIQLRSALHELNLNKLKKLIIAYEPVWAISKGTGATDAGKHCDESEANSIHQFIKNIVKQLLKDGEPIVLFGGSVRPNTTNGYLKQPNIDGILVGAASTNLDSWSDIVHNAC